MTAERTPAHYVHGMAGPVVIVPGRIAAWLERHADLNTVRVSSRGLDAEADAVLVALRVAALAWRGAATGSQKPAEPEVPGSSRQWMTTTQAGTRLGITDRAVRLAIQEGRLPATNVDGHWRITNEDIAHFTAAKKAA